MKSVLSGMRVWGRWLPLAFAMACAPAHAQSDYPSRPIRLIVPFSAGGGVDLTARELAHRLSGPLGQSIVVENRPGAGGALGVRGLIGADADGYTLLLGTAGEVAITPLVNPAISYDARKDLTPVALVVKAPNVLVVNPDVPVKDLAGLVGYARANPKALTYGTSGIGTAQHLAGELFNKLVGVQAQHVPYKGSSQQVLDVVARRISMTYASPAAVKPFVEKGQLRALGVTTAERIATLPDVPAIGEVVPGYALQSWFALFAPAKTDARIVQRLNEEVSKAMRDPAFIATLRATVGEPAYDTPAEVAAFIAQDIGKFEKIVRDAGITMQE
ncbi:Bug family tripartite tricarboxylate transporter substrate binding protein [Bordetella genomosp. 13]|uniref:Bug family tripartite tricarboxylate transporter substrate binding protein n=1 Tax=Bordetella genomosp. 13 TaxID=463040 RepID=UPI00119EB7F6|nr:tripartite tricarboxylate transporter substrate binding protein [Bordetella genomosp. 13]